MHTRVHRPVLPAAMLLVFLGAASPALAVTYTFQDRSFSGYAREISTPGITDARVAADFGHFNDSFSILYEPTLPGTATSTARQDSLLLPSGIIASAGARAGIVGNQAPVIAGVTNTMNVRFSVAAATPFRLDGTMAWSQNNQFSPQTTDVRIMLTRTGDVNPIFDLRRSAIPFSSRNFSGAAALTGTLQPGSYLLHAFILGEAPAGNTSGGGEYAFELQVPAPGASAILLAGAALAAPRRRRAPCA